VTGRTCALRVENVTLDHRRAVPAHRGLPLIPTPVGLGTGLPLAATATVLAPARYLTRSLPPEIALVRGNTDRG
jgi:hypothetical protein